MKRIFSLVLIAALLLPLLTGCGLNAEDDTLTILMPDNRLLPLMDAMSARFPEIHFQIESYIGDNNTGYLSERIIHGDAGDLIYYTVFTPLEEHISQFYDLSGTTFMHAINPDILSMIDVDGALYQVPGPLDVRCISYNKTLFEDYGWQVPGSFDELIALVKQIRRDAPGITPIACAGQDGFYFSLPASIAQAGFLSTSEGYQWEQAFFRGEASLAEGFAEGLAGTARLIDAGAFDAEKYDQAWGCEAALVNREAAMNIQWQGVDPLFAAIEEADTSDVFGLLPFMGLNESDKVMVFNYTGCWSINRRLEEAGNEKKLENALKIMQWLTTAEAQDLLRSNNTQLSVAGEDGEMDPRISELLEFAANGYKAPMMYTGYEHILAETGSIIAKAALAASSEEMQAQFVQVGDTLNRQYAQSRDASLFHSYVEADLNEEQTAQLLANILLQTGMGDLALITHTGSKNGVENGYGAAGVLYAGGVTSNDILIINASRKMHVATVKLTGSEIRSLLEQGKGLYQGERDAWEDELPLAENADALPQEYFPYFWSGLDVTMEGGRVTSMKLDGEELEDAQTYTVIFAQNDYPRACRQRAAVSDLLIQDAMVSYFLKTPQVTAPEVLRK